MRTKEVDNNKDEWIKPLVLQLDSKQTAEEKGTVFLDAECVGSTDEPGLCS